MTQQKRMEILALIPARGGSVGIPRKNIRLLAGKPLIAYSIEDAQASRLITRTIVSTDDDEIAEVARNCGAEVPFKRPKELAQNLSPDIPTFQHALRWLKEKERYEPEVVVNLRATCPIRRVQTIDAAIRELLAHPQADSLRAVSRPLQSPYKMWRIEKGYLEPLLRLKGMREPYNMPRQILPEIFWQNGYIDIVRSKTVQKGMMNGRTILPFIIRDEEWVEIDYEEDLQKAEEILKRRRQGLESLSAVGNVERHPA